MAGHGDKNVCQIRSVSGVVMLIVMATASTACSEKGGMLDHNRCVCKAGYTGPKCDISLSDDLKYVKNDRKDLKLTFEVELGDKKHVRVRRQNDPEAGSGAGDNNETETTSTGFDATAAQAATTPSIGGTATPATDATETAATPDTTSTPNTTVQTASTPTDSNSTEAAPATTDGTSTFNATEAAPVTNLTGLNATTAVSDTSAQITTSSIPTQCPAGQAKNPNTGCVDATILQGQIKIDNLNFSNDLNNLSSPTSQNLIATITAEVERLMAGTSFNKLDITGFTNGSVIVGGLFVFEQTAKSVNELLALSGLLQSRMINANSTLQIAQVIAIDTDECAGNTAPCPNNTACTNTPGSFTCACVPGYNPTFANGSLDVCTPQCASVQCLNGGSCVVENNSTFCSCPVQFSGARCEGDSFPLQQATIAVSVVLGVLVLIALLLIIFVLCHKTRSKKKTSNDLPLATGFKTNMDDDFPKQVYDNPQDVASDENRSSLRIEEEHPEPDNYTNSTSTFKPDDGAAKADSDDKL